jgi:dTMP kinase
MNLFITLEGPEGSGKSTQAPRLADHLRQKGWSVLLTREPGGTPIGDQIRTVLHDLGNTSMHPRTELLLYSASRAIVNEVIRGHLSGGSVVRSLRGFSMAYQGYGQGLPLESCASSPLSPPAADLDLTFLLDLPVNVGLARRRGSTEWESPGCISDRIPRARTRRLCLNGRRRSQALVGGRREPESDQVWQQMREKLRRGWAR